MSVFVFLTASLIVLPSSVALEFVPPFPWLPTTQKNTHLDRTASRSITSRSAVVRVTWCLFWLFIRACGRFCSSPSLWPGRVSDGLCQHHEAYWVRSISLSSHPHEWCPVYKLAWYRSYALCSEEQLGHVPVAVSCGTQTQRAVNPRPFCIQCPPFPSLRVSARR